jgi:hypothetical protein
MCWLLWEKLTMVGRDVLQPARVSLKTQKNFPTQFFLVLPPLINAFFWFLVQCLAQDMAEMAELQEEVTQAQAAALLAGARAAHAKGVAREKTMLLVTTRGEAAEVT